MNAPGRFGGGHWSTQTSRTGGIYMASTVKDSCAVCNMFKTECAMLEEKALRTECECNLPLPPFGWIGWFSIAF